MKSIDLHMHSIYSDGTYSPTQLVTAAKAKGLSAISLTDHDTIDGLDEARRQAEIMDLHFINGVEINSFYLLDHKKINIHVLGYAFGAKEIESFMQKLKVIRYEHNEAMRKALHAIGIEISYADMELQSEKNIVTRFNFAKALVKKGYVENVKEALDKYLHKGGTAYVEYNNYLFSVVAKKIHDAGGIVSLAHPAEYRLTDTETEQLILALKREGLDAIECIHPSQDAQYADNLMKLAKQNDLKRTGGSDFHEINDKGINIGFGGSGMCIPENFLEELGVE